MKMQFKYTVLFICALGLTCHGQGVDRSQTRRIRQTAAQALRDTILRQRLTSFPLSSPYQTQTIHYPGSAGITQQFDASPIPIANPVPLPILRATTTTTTTTTELPVIENFEPIIEEQPIVPKLTVRAPAIRRPAIRQRIQQVNVDDQFQDLSDVKPTIRPETSDERLLRDEQNKNAHYTFGTSIQDTINDHAIERQETRDGLALKGMYSYSDGFFKRTVHYEADENGYRVVKEEIEPIGDGPQFNPKGKADVSATLHGSHSSYSITADDFVRDHRKKVEIDLEKQI